MAVVINGLTGIEAPSVTLDTDTLVIDATNNRVGIGTTSPAYSLDIDGNARLNPTSNPVLRFSENGTLRSLITGSSSIGLGIETQGALPFRVVTNGSESMRITSSGLVGIGTSSPASILHINGAGTNDFPHLRVTADRGLIARLGDTSGSAQSLFDLYDTDGTTQIVKFISGGADCFINTGGNVGIGTTSPLAGSKLDVIGRINARDNERISLVPGANPNDPCIIETGGGSPIAFSPEGSEAMRIDTSGNLIVGSTSASGVSSGGKFYATPSSGMYAAASGDNAGYFNRTSTDGSIVEFRKNNSAVGQIGNVGGTTYYAGASTGIRMTSSDARPTNVSGSDEDGTKDLGDASARWRDLYLSGGVYLGGTGAANKLDDYEEGTFTPTINRSTGSPTVSSYNDRVGKYTVVGNVLYWYCYVETPNVSGGSGHWRMTGLPFTSSTAYPFPVVNARIYMDGDSNNYMMKVESNLDFTALFTNSNDTRYATNTSYVIWELSGFYYIS